MKFSYTLLKNLLPKVPPAKKLAEQLNFHSFEVEEAAGDMLDIKLPSNVYSSAGSHIGVAREAAAINGLAFSSPVKKPAAVSAGRGLIKVKIEEARLCLRYSARYFEIPA